MGDLSKVQHTLVSRAEEREAGTNVMTSEIVMRSDEMRAASGVIILSMWGIWKERNQRAFCSAEVLPTEVAELVRKELALRVFTHTLYPGGFFVFARNASFP